MTNSPKSGERERWDWDSITEISNKSGIGMISEYDRQAIRALKTQYEVSLKRIEKLEDALLKYGSHATRCACLADTIDNEYDIPCTCGFSEVLAADQGEET